MDILLLFGEIRGIGQLAVDHAINGPILAQRNGIAGLTGVHMKGRTELGRPAEVIHGAGAREKIAGFGFQTQSLGRFFQVLAGLDLLRQFLRLALCQFRCFIAPVIRKNLIVNFRQRCRMSRLVFLHGNDHVSLVGADGSAVVARAQAENRPR